MPSEFASSAAVAFDASARSNAATLPRRRPTAPSLVLVPAASRPAEAVQTASRQTPFADSMETAFGGLVMLSVLLFAAALLRLCWAGPLISTNSLHFAADAADGVAAILGCAFLFIVIRDLVSAVKK